MRPTVLASQRVLASQAASGDGLQVDASGEGGIGRARDGPGGVRVPVLVGGERPTRPLVALYCAFGECHRRQRAGAQGGASAGASVPPGTTFQPS